MNIKIVAPSLIDERQKEPENCFLNKTELKKAY